MDIIKYKLDETLLRIRIMDEQIDDLSGRLINLEFKVAKIKNGSGERECNSRVTSRDCFVELEERFSRLHQLTFQN